MNVAQTNNKIAPMLSNLFDYFSKNGLDRNKSHNAYLSEAKKFVHTVQIHDEQIKELESLSFYNPSIYNFFAPKVDKKKDAFDFISDLVSFQNIVIDIVNNKDIGNAYWVVTDNDVTEHIASKPLDAYTDKGHNELEIKTSKLKYSHLL